MDIFITKSGRVNGNYFLSIKEMNRQTASYAIYAFNAKTSDSTNRLKYGDLEIILKDGKYHFISRNGAVIENIRSINFMGSVLKGITDDASKIPNEDLKNYALSANAKSIMIGNLNLTEELINSLVHHDHGDTYAMVEHRHQNLENEINNLNLRLRGIPQPITTNPGNLVDNSIMLYYGGSNGSTGITTVIFRCATARTFGLRVMKLIQNYIEVGFVGTANEFHLGTSSWRRIPVLDANNNMTIPGNILAEFNRLNTSINNHSHPEFEKLETKIDYHSHTGFAAENHTHPELQLMNSKTDKFFEQTVEFMFGKTTFQAMYTHDTMRLTSFNEGANGMNIWNSTDISIGQITLDHRLNHNPLIRTVITPQQISTPQLVVTGRIINHELDDILNNTSTCVKGYGAKYGIRWFQPPHLVAGSGSNMGFEYIADVVCKFDGSGIVKMSLFIENRVENTIQTINFLDIFGVLLIKEMVFFYDISQMIIYPFPGSAPINDPHVTFFKNSSFLFRVTFANRVENMSLKELYEVIRIDTNSGRTNKLSHYMITFHCLIRDLDKLMSVLEFFIGLEIVVLPE
jgi:hypothetical protein